MLYREISKDHKDSLNDIIKNKFTGETVTSNDFFKIFIVRWEDLLIDCEHRMNYLKNRLEDKKKNMLRNKKEEEYKKSPMSKYIGQTNEENKNG